MSGPTDKQQYMPGSQQPQDLKTIGFDDFSVHFVMRHLPEKKETGRYEVKRNSHTAHKVFDAKVCVCSQFRDISLKRRDMYDEYQNGTYKFHEIDTIEVPRILDGNKMVFFDKGKQ